MSAGPWPIPDKGDTEKTAEGNPLLPGAPSRAESGRILRSQNGRTAAWIQRRDRRTIRDGQQGGKGMTGRAVPHRTIENHSASGAGFFEAGTRIHPRTCGPFRPCHDRNGSTPPGNRRKLLPFRFLRCRILSRPFPSPGERQKKTNCAVGKRQNRFLKGPGRKERRV